MFSEAAALGALHVHLSGGEPTARRDIAELTRHASRCGLYTNLITSGIGVSEKLFAQLVEAGLDHAQLSFQGADKETNDRLGHYAGSWERKRAFAAMVTKAGLPLTINAVIHRANLGQVGAFIDLAVELGARRLEVAHTQYYGWALANRAALMPPKAEVDKSIAVVEEARARLKGELVIDMVVPDYYARYPKPCAGGWGRIAINVSPSGKVLPCHAAETIPGLEFWNVRDRSLSRYLARQSGFQGFSRHGMDARTLPLVRPARDRLGRLPLPGAGADRRRAQRRSRLPQIPAPRPHRGPRRGRGGGRGWRGGDPLAVAEDRGRARARREVRAGCRRAGVTQPIEMDGAMWGMSRFIPEVETMTLKTKFFRATPIVSPSIRRISARCYSGSRCLRPDRQRALSQAARSRQPRDGNPQRQARNLA